MSGLKPTFGRSHLAYCVAPVRVNLAARQVLSQSSTMFNNDYPSSTEDEVAHNSLKAISDARSMSPSTNATRCLQLVLVLVLRACACATQLRLEVTEGRVEGFAGQV
jgi:hypothetical protein